jgi:hypothetical protein
MLSLPDLMRLGGGVDRSADAWGMADLPVSGCICSKLPAPGAVARRIGRPQLGLVATTIADLNLRVAIELHELNLPAAIAKDVLGAAMQDYIDEVRPATPDDWLTLVHGALAMTRERLEDYVAAVTANGALVPDSRPPER